MAKTTIMVEQTTLERFNKFKIIPRESSDTALNRLMDEVERKRA